MRRAERTYPADFRNPESLLIAKEGREDVQAARSDAFASRETRGQAKALRGLLERIPEPEAMVLALTAEGMAQERIGSHLGIGQPTVSYRLHRALERLRWLRGIGGWFTPVDALRDLDGPLRKEQALLLALWWAIASQSRIARRLGLEKNDLRARLMRSVRELRASAEVDPKYPVGFVALWEVGSILHRPEERKERR